MQRFFLDTNIFVYALLASEPLKRARAIDLIESALATRQGCISAQVAQEFTNVALRKFAQRAQPADLADFFTTALRPLITVNTDADLVSHALGLHMEYRYAYYDSLIIAAAQRAQVAVLYSEDLQHGQRLGDLRIENPFLMAVNEAA